MADDHSFTVRLEQDADYQFRVIFDAPAIPALQVDEPEPLGKNTGPNAARLVVAAVANCLTASLLFAARKFKQDPGALRASATAHIKRNDKGRFRIEGIDVGILLGANTEQVERFARAFDQFEDFCIVTQSIRQGIPVRVSVKDGTGRLVHEAK